MPVFRLLKNEIVFPDPTLAEDGLLAIGGDLSPERILQAYRVGIFPWYNDGEPILWWCPDPRFVLYPNELKVAKSMRPYFNQNKFQVTFDKQFRSVINACKVSKRGGQQIGSWITNEMLEAYCHLHQLGYAHSVEVISEDGELVGGLYGISLGKLFFGESMFTKVDNASKFGFITLVQKLTERGFWLVDCQQETKHLSSLGAKLISRSLFLEILKKNEKEETLVGSWTDI